MHQACDVRYFRALQALLRFSTGTAVGVVAQEAGVTPQMTWVWRKVYRVSRGDERVLRPVPPPGASPLTGPSQNAQIESILQEDPQALGYQATGWTVPLLQYHLQVQSICLSQRTVRRRLKSLGYVWKRPSYVLAYPDPQWKAKCRYIRRRVRRIREKHPNAIILFVDETDLRELPPLRAGWARRGKRFRIPITGRNSKRVLFGALNYQTGHRIMLVRRYNRLADFQAFLDMLKKHYKGRPLSLILDRCSSHVHNRAYARKLSIGLIWLPRACPKLNPMEDLWRELKRTVAADRCYADINELAERALRWMLALTHRHALRKAGLLTGKFWLYV